MAKKIEIFKKLISTEPIFIKRLSFADTHSQFDNLTSGTIFFGTGLCTPKKLSKGVPFDILSMILAAELLRKKLGFSRVFHLIADTHARNNNIAKPEVIGNLALKQKSVFSKINKNFGLNNFTILLASEIDKKPEFQRLFSSIPFKSSDNDYVRREVCDTEWFRTQKNTVIKLGWAIDAKKVRFDERLFQERFQKLVSTPISFIFVRPGKSFDPKKINVPPYISINNSKRILLNKKENVKRKMTKAKLNLGKRLDEVLDHFQNIISLFEKTVEPINVKLNLEEKIDFIINKACGYEKLNLKVEKAKLSVKMEERTMDKIDEVLSRGVEKIYPSKEALEKVLRSGKKIRLYQGFDPSMPNLHLGNFVGILKLKQFQDLGHEVIFLVGDFTGMIGDPTDKSSARKRLTRQKVLKNCQNWQKQAGRILKFGGNNPAKIMFNSQWLDKITFKNLIEITSNFTVQQMIERDFFQKRLEERKPIFLHEFLYPVAQAIDCVEMDVDLEVGGTDQTFNMLVGRSLMKALKGKEKSALTTKLLVDSKGEKVGKTAGNALFLNASATGMYGGIMSFPDEVIIAAFELLTQVPVQLIKAHQGALASRRVNPMDLKKQLAFEIVKMYRGEKAAQMAQKEFERVFQKQKLPSKIPVFKTQKTNWLLINLLVKSKLIPSKSEAKRLISQGAVEINKQKTTDPKAKIKIEEDMIIRVGKRKFIKLKS